MQKLYLLWGAVFEFEALYELSLVESIEIYSLSTRSRSVAFITSLLNKSSSIDESDILIMYLLNVDSDGTLLMTIKPQKYLSTRFSLS